MGCQPYRQRFIEKTKNISNNAIDERIIEQIILNTSCKLLPNLVDERDIYHLAIKFLKLEPNNKSLISNTQLLELPEFKYCPFRSHLLRVFKLDNDQGSDTDMFPNNVYAYSLDPVSKLNQNNNFMNSFDKNKSGHHRRRDSYIRGDLMVGKQYIDFKKFCEIMKVFNFRTPPEVKIKCNHFIILVYFDLYDIDGDGKITPKDLKDFLLIINTSNDHDSEACIDRDSLDSYYEAMISRIMKELLADYRRKHIEFEEFKAFMWSTNIDKTCVIYLEHE
jgi:Ca2+-binding EF-hand superfamily protein